MPARSRAPLPNVAASGPLLPYTSTDSIFGVVIGSILVCRCDVERVASRHWRPHWYRVGGVSADLDPRPVPDGTRGWGCADDWRRVRDVTDRFPLILQ